MKKAIFALLTATLSAVISAAAPKTFTLSSPDFKATMAPGGAFVARIEL